MEVSLHRYLFLDIDGVLNGNRQYKIWRAMPAQDRTSEQGLLSLLCPQKIDLLNSLHSLDLQIILSTTWRLPDVVPFDTLSLLRKAGLSGEMSVVDSTPDLGTFSDNQRVCFGVRGKEILLKVQELGLGKKQFVVLDDDPNVFFGGSLVCSRWVRTPSATGLDLRHIKKIFQMCSE